MRLDALLTRLGLGSRSEMQKLIRRGAAGTRALLCSPERRWRWTGTRWIPGSSGR